MRNKGLFLSAACLAISSTAMAFEPVQGWYGGIIGELSRPSTLNFTTTVPPITTATGKLSYRIGGGAGVLLGYRMEPWRFEGEILFNYNNYSKLTLGNLELKRYNSSTSSTTPYSMKGKTYMIAGMLNAFYDLYQVQASQDSQIIPYIGLGIGFAQIHNKLEIYNYGTLLGTALSTSNSEGAVQVILGAQYFADDFTSVGLDYRYLTTKKVGNTNQRFNINSLNLSLNFAFDSSD